MGMILAFMLTRALFMAAALALPLGSAALAADADGPEPPEELRVEGMIFVSSEGSQNDAIVEAGSANMGREDRVAQLTVVHARVGTAAGATTATSLGGLELQCDRGSFDLGSGDLFVEGNDRGVMADGCHFETEHVVYRWETGRVSTRSPVVIKDSFGTIRGAGFEYWVRENRFRLIGGASVEQGR